MFNIRDLKLEGKTIIRGTMIAWFKLVLCFVVFGIALEVFSDKLGGALPLYIVTLENFPDTVTGISRIEGGIQLILRMDLMGTVASFTLTQSQLLLLVVIQLILTIVLSPFRMVVLEHLWKSFRSEDLETGKSFRWYREPGLLGKSLVIGLLVGLGSKIITFVLMLPSFALSFLIASGDMTSYLGGSYGKTELVAALGLVLLFMGAFFSFYINCTLEPIYYCLAAKPEYSIGKVISQGLRSTKGYRMQFFLLRLSFFPWYIVSRFSYGMIDMYFLPYRSFTSFCFLREVAIRKEK